MGTLKRMFVGGPTPAEVVEYLALADRVAKLHPDPEHLSRVRQIITADLVRSWSRRQFDAEMEQMRLAYRMLSDPIEREEIYTLSALCLMFVEAAEQQGPLSKKDKQAAQDFRKMAAEHMFRVPRAERQQLIRELTQGLYEEFGIRMPSHFRR